MGEMRLAARRVLLHFKRVCRQKGDHYDDEGEREHRFRFSGKFCC